MIKKSIFRLLKLIYYYTIKSKQYKINFEESSVDLLKKVDTVMICVKPSDFFNLLGEISGKIESKHLVLSIAAAIKLGQIEKVCVLMRKFLNFLFIF